MCALTAGDTLRARASAADRSRFTELHRAQRSYQSLVDAGRAGTQRSVGGPTKMAVGIGVLNNDNSNIDDENDDDDAAADDSVAGGHYAT